jgi:predicted nucleic acid-binding protein
MTETIFVDTNLLIYALDPADVKKQESALAWQEELWNSQLGRISFQVLQEFYAKAIRKWPSLHNEVRSEIMDMLTWQPVPIDGAILDLSWRIQDRYQLSFWDSLIVAAAKSINCRYLLTEDLQAGQDLDGVLVVNPFRTEPGSLFRK